MESPNSSIDSSPSWRDQLRREVRTSIIQQLVAVLATIFLPIFSERFHILQIMGPNLEAAAYRSANDQEEYVRQITSTLSLFWMQTHLFRLAHSSNRASVSSRNQTANITPERQEEAYQKVQCMKAQHSANIRDICERLRWHHNELGRSLMQGWQGLKILVRMRVNVCICELILRDLQANKPSIGIRMIENIPKYEVRLPRFIDRHRRSLDRLANSRPQPLDGTGQSN